MLCVGLAADFDLVDLMIFSLILSIVMTAVTLDSEYTFALMNQVYGC